MTTVTSNPIETFIDRVLVIRRVFDAPRRLLYEAWTKKEHLDKWSAPHDFQIPFSEADVRPGGAWRCAMLAPDGVEYRVGGTYQEVIADELLSFTHAWEDEKGNPGHKTLVTARFSGEGHQTKLSLKQAIFQTVRSRDSHHGGWTECLDCLAEHLAHLPRFEAPNRTS
jgi:uncharacterized protein YndB with AHSA1/START domain